MTTLIQYCTIKGNYNTVIIDCLPDQTMLLFNQNYGADCARIKEIINL